MQFLKSVLFRSQRRLPRSFHSLAMTESAIMRSSFPWFAMTLSCHREKHSDDAIPLGLSGGGCRTGKAWRQSLQSLKALLLVLISILYLGITPAFAAKVSGTLAAYPGQEIKLIGFDGFDKRNLATATTDENGGFSLDYGSYIGIGHLQLAKTNEGSIIILNGSDIVLQVDKGKKIYEQDFIENKENQLWVEYAKSQNTHDKARQAWQYLAKLYKNSAETDLLNLIAGQLAKLEEKDQAQLRQLPENSVLSLLVPIRKLIQAMTKDVVRAPENIPLHIETFKKIDLTHAYLWHSDLLEQLVRGHYIMLENSGNPLPKVFELANVSSDHILKALNTDASKKNTMAKFLFDFLRKRSMFKSARYLALQLLESHQRDLSDTLIKRLHVYHDLANGKAAPTVEFKANTVAHNGNLLDQGFMLNKDQSEYHILVFFKAGCKSCEQTLDNMKILYPRIKTMQVTVVYQDRQDWKQHINYPWVSGWNPSVFDKFHIWQDVTYFILDKDLKFYKIHLPLIWDYVESFVTKMQSLSLKERL